MATHASDTVLKALFVDIHDRRLAAGDVLPAERELAQRHGVSRITVRQAVHKLKDAGLVAVQQGGATRVLHARPGDARLLPLLHRFGHLLEHDPRMAAELREAQELYALGLIEAAARHADAAQRAALVALVESCPEAPDDSQARQLDATFWPRVAEIGGNRIQQMEVALWAAWNDAGAHLGATPQVLRWFCLTLARQLQAGQDPIPFYLASVRTTASP
jgi:GntR family transcriptional regulator, transcriptional repressor for pyruvate dehydrogenase complex